MNVKKRFAASGYSAIGVKKDEAFPGAFASTKLSSRLRTLEKRNIPMQVGSSM